VGVIVWVDKFWGKAYFRHFDVLAHVLMRAGNSFHVTQWGFLIKSFEGASGMSESAKSSFIRINPFRGASQEMIRAYINQPGLHQDSDCATPFPTSPRRSFLIYYHEHHCHYGRVQECISPVYLVVMILFRFGFFKSSQVLDTGNAMPVQEPEGTSTR
jgi:hypothetical protein